MSDWSQHRMVVTVGEGWLGFAVKCGHDSADTTRPCWPYDVEQEPPVPMPAPQGCNLADWCDSLDPEDWLHGDVDFECGVDVTWGGDGSPEVRLVVGDQEAPTKPRTWFDRHGQEWTDGR